LKNEYITEVFSTTMAKKEDHGAGIPDHAVDSLVRCLLPEIQKYFESEEGRAEFEKWKAQQMQLKQGRTSGN